MQRVKTSNVKPTQRQHNATPRKTMQRQELNTMSTTTQWTTTQWTTTQLTQRHNEHNDTITMNTTAQLTQRHDDTNHTTTQWTTQRTIHMKQWTTQWTTQPTINSEWIDATIVDKGSHKSQQYGGDLMIYTKYTKEKEISIILRSVRSSNFGGDSKMAKLRPFVPACQIPISGTFWQNWPK